jgi:UDP-2,3-diacylglucosamine pyrophosphatase LpxH
MRGPGADTVFCVKQKRVLVLSDLHIGTGHRQGRPNVYDDFREDERFEQLLAHHSEGERRDDEVHLVLNGDIFDLLKVSVNGQFPEKVTERLALMKLEQCLRGHPRVVNALAMFLSRPQNRITYQPGNHDMELFFPKVQRMFCRALTGEDTHLRVNFISEAPFFEIEDGIQFHHGHQFEAVHAMDFKRLFLTRGLSEPILNQPWGSLFILQVVNRFMPERPYLDKVMPFWPLFVGGALFDTRFTLRMAAASAYYYGRARLNPVWWEKRPFDKLFRFVRTEFKFFERLDLFAERILKNPQLRGVFMGHTHVEMVRSYKGGKVYVNTGTWMPMVSFKMPKLGPSSALHYGQVEWDEQEGPRLSLMRWHGRQPPSEEVTS